MAIFYCEPVPSGQCSVVLQYSLCDTYWKVKNLFIMQVYTWCTGNIGHSAFIYGYFCVFGWSSTQEPVVKCKEQEFPLSQSRLAMLWKCWRIQSPQCTHIYSWREQKSLRWLLCHKHFLWSCINDWSEKGLWLITLSMLACFQRSQVLEPSRIYQV